MHRIIFTISLLLIFVLPALSQETIDFADANNKTLQYTNSAQWDSVIYFGNLALKNNIDYFYLRVRMGMAYYNKQKYVNAISEFKKALLFNASDTYTQEMLYYSYVFAGRTDDALYFSSEMADAAKKEAGIKKTAILNSLYFEGGPTISNNISKNSSIDFNDKPNLNGNASLMGNIYYGHIGGKIQAGKSLSFYAGISMLSEELNFYIDDYDHIPSGRIFKKRDTIIWKPLPQPGQYTYDTIYENYQAFANKPVSSSLATTLKQKEFYFSLHKHLKNGIDITPFIHLLSLSYTQFLPWVHKIEFTSHDTIETHTQFYFPTPPGGMTDTVFYTFLSPVDTIAHVTFIERDTSFVNFSVGTGLSKNFGYITVSVFGNFSNLNGSKQKEAGTSITYFPFGNLNLYLNATITAIAYKRDKMKSFGFLAGKKITKKLWLEGSASFGDIKNFTEKNGFIVNNSPDLTKLCLGLMPVFIFGNFSVNVQYFFQSKEGNYYFTNEIGGISTRTVVYQNQTITGGVTWRF